MNLGMAKSIVLASTIAMIVLRAPHGLRSRFVEIAHDRKGRLEVLLLSLVSIGFVIPFIWSVSTIFAFAKFPLQIGSLIAGVLLMGMGLWILHVSHMDLGTNWSSTLQIREHHRLITEGIYRKIRHPMYLSIFVYGLGQALVIPNWFAGPACLVMFGIFYVFRLPAEEKLMCEVFGKEYEAYMARTTRLIPKVW